MLANARGWAGRVPRCGRVMMFSDIAPNRSANIVRWPITLTFVLIAFFIIEGIASIMFALDHRQELPGSWGAMLFSGIVDLVLGGMIFLGLPSSAAWAIGLLVGINMVFGGAALIAMALHARKLNTPSSLRTVR